jgi:hypothetical protein
MSNNTRSVRPGHGSRSTLGLTPSHGPVRPETGSRPTRPRPGPVRLGRGTYLFLNVIERVGRVYGIADEDDVRVGVRERSKAAGGYQRGLLTFPTSARTRSPPGRRYPTARALPFYHRLRRLPRSFQTRSGRRPAGKRRSPPGRRVRTSGNMPFEKTISRHVLPAAPSPTMTCAIAVSPDGISGGNDAASTLPTYELASDLLRAGQRMHAVAAAGRTKSLIVSSAAAIRSRRGSRKDPSHLALARSMHRGGLAARRRFGVIVWRCVLSSLART